MKNWIKFTEQTPPEYVSPQDPPATFYDVKLEDGTETRMCWWLGHWYQTHRGFEVEYWKEVEEENDL